MRVCFCNWRAQEQKHQSRLIKERHQHRLELSSLQFMSAGGTLQEIS